MGRLTLDRWSSDYWEWRETWDEKDAAIASLLDDDRLTEFEEVLFRKDAGIDLDRGHKLDEDSLTIGDLWLRYDAENEPVDKDLWRQCIAEAKRKMKIWPSAYGSLFASKIYRAKFKQKHPGGQPWKVKKDAIDLELQSDADETHLTDLLDEFDLILDSSEEISEHEDDLRQWLREKWVRLGGSGEILSNCGDRNKSEGFAKCLPLSRAKSLTKEERAKLVARKRRKVKKNHSGKPIHTSSMI